MLTLEPYYREKKTLEIDYFTNRRIMEHKRNEIMMSQNNHRYGDYISKKLVYPIDNYSSYR